jgi:phosphocarrier protein
VKTISYVLTDPLGLHARPAGQLVKTAAKFKSAIEIGIPGKMVNAKCIIGVMSLTLKAKDTLIMTFSGEDEEAASEACRVFLEEKL